MATSVTETKRDQNSALWYEFQELERRHCCSHGQVGLTDLNTAEKARLRDLSEFFALEQTRSRFSTALIHLIPVGERGKRV